MQVAVPHPPPAGDAAMQLQGGHRDAPLDKYSSEEDEEAEEYEEHDDDNHSVVGVSIGPLQRQLTSPSATHAQKKNALVKSARNGLQETDYFTAEGENEDPELPDDSDGDEVVAEPVATRRSRPQLYTELPNRNPRASLPSPWIAQQEAGAIRTRTGRPRAATAVDSNHHEQGFRKYLPSIPKVLLPGKTSIPVVGTALSWLQNSENNAKTSGPHPIETTVRRNSVSSPDLPETSNRSPTSPDLLSPLTPIRPRAPLRRVTSDGSLHLHRPLSHASSLGDDSRWTDVHEQVNSRMKAIKDSLADSNLKLPKLPALPSIDVRIPGVRTKKLEDDRRPADTSVPRAAAFAQPAGNISEIQGPPPAGFSKSSAKAHPFFTKALRHLKGDLVILGGYRGSILRSAEPPHRQLWVPVKVGLNLRKVNLEVGLEPEDEERMTDNIIPSGMLKHIGPVDISRRLFKRIQGCKNAQDGTLRVWDFGYDWRLSPDLLSKHLIAFLEALQCNSPDAPASDRGATIIAHSLGGLITRHANNQRPELFRGVVYAGVPQHCVNILGPLRNGDDVLLSSRVLTAQVNFTIRTSFALLPLDGKCFIDSDTRERYDVDFFDPKTWDELRLSPCINRPYPVAEPTRGIVGSMASVFRDLPGRRSSSPKTRSRNNSGASTPKAGIFSKETRMNAGDGGRGRHIVGPQMDHLEEPSQKGDDPETNVSTAVTIPKEDAVKYLTRTLAEVKRFKQDLAFRPELADKYCPIACVYGKSVPTVCGAQVKGREAIKYADAYDDLAFASGDGVVLARAAQIPTGYKVSRGGVVSSDRGHIGLLGDLEAVGRCLLALEAERRRRRKGTVSKT